MKTIYLIDYENIQNDVIERLQTMYHHEIQPYYLVFYTEHTQKPGKLLEELPDDVTVSFQHCYCNSDNALDFQLTTTLGQLTTRYPRNKYVIVSNDRGYTPAIQMLQDQGYRVFQEILPHTSKQTAPNLPEPETDLQRALQKTCMQLKIPKAWKSIYDIVLKYKNYKDIKVVLDRTFKKSNVSNTLYFAIKRNYNQPA